MGFRFICWFGLKDGECSAGDFGDGLAILIAQLIGGFEARTCLRTGADPRWPLTCQPSRTPQQPLNNLPRVAIQALAAVLGGTQSLHTDSHDEALAVPTAEAALLALRQQQIIAEETGVDATVDPLGGSWFVEALTNETERAVWRWAGWLAISLAGVAAGLRFFPRYYFQLLPVTIIAASAAFNASSR